MSFGQQSTAGPTVEHTQFARRRLLVAALVLGVVVRVVVFVLREHIGYGDMGQYTRGALTLLAGEVPDMRPGLAPLIALPIVLGVPFDRAAQTMTLFFGSLLLLLLYVMVRRLYGTGAALGTLLLAAVNHHLISASTNGMAEAPVLCAVVGALLFVHAGKRTRLAWWHLLAAGLLFGYAFSIRSENMIHLAGVAIAMAVIIRHNRARAAADIGALVLGFLCIAVAGTLVRGKAPTMASGVDMGTPNALLQYDPTVTQDPEAFREAVRQRMPEEWLEEAGAEVPELTWRLQARRYVHNLHAQIADVLPQTVDLGLWPLVGLGLFGATWAVGRWKTELIFASLWLFFFTAAPLAQLVHPRHLLIYLVIALCWAGAGVVNFGRWYSRTTQGGEIVPRAVRKGAIVALVFAGLFQLKPDLDFIQAAFNGEIATEEKAAGHWLRDYARPDDLVLERKTTVTFYSGLRGDETPYTSYERVIEYARTKDVRFIVVSSRNLMAYRPQLSRLLDDESTWEADLKLVHEARNRHNADFFIRIFEVRDPGQPDAPDPQSGE
ncbi:MAG: glycosyltransferase family 39 protein [Armatimonadota bacterium]